MQELTVRYYVIVLDQTLKVFQSAVKVDEFMYFITSHVQKKFSCKFQLSPKKK